MISTIGDIGVALLLFTVGLHINLRSLIQIQVFGVGGIHFVITTTVFTGILVAFQLSLWPALVLAAGLALSSTVLTAKSLDSRGELDSYHGRLTISILILQDVIAVVLLIAALARYTEHKNALEAAGVNVSFLPINQAGRELAQANLGQLTTPSIIHPQADK